MRQLFQDLRRGAIHLEELPAPGPMPGRLLIQGECSLISAGTERMLLDFGRGSWLQKVRSQPDKVRQVRQKIQSDGLLPTLRAVRRKLADPMPLGYCHVGRVVAVGAGVEGFKAGDRVLSNGPHAELVSVPKNLCAKVPQGLAPEEAVFGVLGAIALQGLRLMEPTLGERVVVIGLGLVGQLAVQLLLAQGCRVLALDLDPQKVALAESFGAEGFCSAEGSPIHAARAFSQGRGVDGVIIAAATLGNGPLVQAAEMCRHRGRIVLVGVVAIQVPRDLFYKKELSFQVSCSYGPGRHDPAYEEGGQDYPFGLVRWTEQRHFEAVLALMAEGRVSSKGLLSARFPFEKAGEAYELLLHRRESMGVLLDYPDRVAAARSVELLPSALEAGSDLRNPGIALIGAGAFAVGTLLPALKDAPPHRLVAVMSRGGGAAQAGRRFGFHRATTDLEDVLGDAAVQAVIIATRHDSHAGLVVRALDAGKHVFVEKPLATDREGLALVEAACLRHPELSLTVGFNRRFAPLVRQVETALKGRRTPLHMVCEVNAGALPEDHWTRGAEGGGRLVGEGCHFVDLMRHLTQSPIRSVQAMGAGPGAADAFTLTLGFEDGSLGTLLYSTQGARSYPKETFSLHWEDRVLRLENFRRLQAWGAKAFTRRTWSQDKGHRGLLHAWIQGLGYSEPIPRNQLFEGVRWTLKAREDLN